MRAWEKNVRKTLPYVPGEQPRDLDIIKLNTNENPYPPSPKVQKTLEKMEMRTLRKYPDPAAGDLVSAIARRYQVKESQVFVGVGSDDVLAMCFLTFFNGEKPILFPDITYSFYEVWAQVFRIPFERQPLDENFRIDPEDYRKENGGVIFPNPNAPTGELLALETVEEMIAANQDSVVIVDEAYIDFGGKSALPFIEKYDNLLVVQTFSKSRSMAGARLGFALGSRELIADLERLKYATNPYNVNRLTLRLGEAAVDSDPYFRANARRIMATRDKTARALREMGFRLPDSQANFLFVTHPRIDGARLYQKCRERGILIRHFSDPAIAQYNRVTIGAEEEMETFLTVVRDILREEGL